MSRVLSENSLTEFCRMFSAGYGQENPLLPGISAVLCPNPSPLTLQGTNTWIIRTSQGSKPLTLVIDPGPYNYQHIHALIQVLRSEERIIILATHSHEDHIGAALPLAQKTRAVINTGNFMPPELFTHNLGEQQQWCQTVMVPDETYSLDIGTFTPVATPGHTDDSVSFVLRPHPATQEENHYPHVVFSGDTLLGSGSTILLAKQAIHRYLQSLRTLIDLGESAVLAPGHGLVHKCTRTLAKEQYDYRHQRIEQLRACIAALDKPLWSIHPQEIVPLLYADKDPSIWPAAQLSVAAQLEYISNYCPSK